MPSSPAPRKGRRETLGTRLRECVVVFLTLSRTIAKINCELKEKRLEKTDLQLNRRLRLLRPQSTLPPTKID